MWFLKAEEQRECVHVSVLRVFNVNAVSPERVLLKYFKYHRRSPVKKSIQRVTEFYYRGLFET